MLVVTDVFMYGWDHTMTNTCWIKPVSAILYSIIIPIGVSIIVNMVCFSIILFSFYKFRSSLGEDNSMSNKQRLFVHFKLTLVIVFTWLFGLLANIDGLETLCYVFISVNSLHSVCIFAVFF